MFFCVVCSCYNDFRCGISMNGIVHLILYCRKEIFRDLAIKGIIDGSSIDVCNLFDRNGAHWLESLVSRKLSVQNNPHRKFDR